MWDVDVMIRYNYEESGDNRQLSKHLSHKLAMLMVLVNANRRSELGALDVQFRVFKPEGVVFKLPSLTKKRITGAPPKEVFFGAFPHDQTLCVVQCLGDYMRSFRNLQDNQQVSRLILSYIS